MLHTGVPRVAPSYHLTKEDPMTEMDSTQTARLMAELRANRASTTAEQMAAPTAVPTWTGRKKSQSMAAPTAVPTWTGRKKSQSMAAPTAVPTWTGRKKSQSQKAMAAPMLALTSPRDQDRARPGPCTETWRLDVSLDRVTPSRVEQRIKTPLRCSTVRRSARLGERLCGPSNGRSESLRIRPYLIVVGAIYGHPVVTR